MTTSLPSAEDVLDFWFGPLDANGRASDEKTAQWWKKSPEFDAEVRERFGALHEAIAKGQHEGWRETARGTLAYIIVLDQFSRNMFRDTPRAFETDPRALAAAEAGVERGFDRELALAERGFFYMPYMHSEDRQAQARCVDLFTDFVATAPEAEREKLSNHVKYAKAHQDIVDRFGRFPHRNNIIGRPSTADEVAFLEQPGSSF
jgi:uncharacterized protein (DUF924 family)